MSDINNGNRINASVRQGTRDANPGVVVNPSRPAVLMEKPKRPLSAYNLFFRDERARLLKILPARHGAKRGKKGKLHHFKINFGDLGKTIGAHWRKLDAATHGYYKTIADQELQAYKKKVKAWKAQQIALGLSPKMQNNNAVLTYSTSSSDMSSTNTIPPHVDEPVKTVTALSESISDEWEPLPFHDPFPEGTTATTTTTVAGRTAANNVAPGQFLDNWSHPVVSPIRPAVALGMAQNPKRRPPPVTRPRETLDGMNAMGPTLLQPRQEDHPRVVNPTIPHREVQWSRTMTPPNVAVDTNTNCDSTSQVFLRRGMMMNHLPKARQNQSLGGNGTPDMLDACRVHQTALPIPVDDLSETPFF